VKVWSFGAGVCTSPIGSGEMWKVAALSIEYYISVLFYCRYLGGSIQKTGVEEM